MAFKMKGSPAKMGTIQGTAGHSSALKQKKSETIERIKKEMDPKVEETLRSFDRPTPGIKTKKPSKGQIKKILEKMKSIKGPGVQLSDDHKKTIEGVEKMIKDQKSPAKQKVKYEKAEPAPKPKTEQLEQKVIKEKTGKLIVKKKSPAKQKQQSSGSEKIQKQQTSKAGQLLRQKQIDAVDAKIETLEEQIFNEEITQEQYDEAMKPLRIKEKQVKKPL